MRLQHTKQRVKEDNIEVDQQKVELESGLPDWVRFPSPIWQHWLESTTALLCGSSYCWTVHILQTKVLVN